MTLDQLCAQLDANGVKITVVDGKLRIDAPAGALSEGLRAGLVEHKAALLGRLAGGGWANCANYANCANLIRR